MGKFSKALSGIDTEPESQSVPGTQPVPVATKPAKQGKRNNPEYTQISAYVRRRIFKAVKSQLPVVEKDFGELVDSLLEEWLRNEGFNEENNWGIKQR